MFEIGVTENLLKPLSLNPTYSCCEINYYNRQSKLKSVFNSLDEMFDELNDNGYLFPVRVTLGLDVESLNCFACNETGYSPIPMLFDKTFYKHSQPNHTESELAIRTEKGETIVSKYGWGSNLEFNEDDLMALKKESCIPDSIESIEDLKLHLQKHPFDLDAVARYVLIQNRALKYVSDIECSSCKGDGSIYKPLKEDPYIMHVWITDTVTGNCGGFFAKNIKIEDVDRAKNYINEVKNKRQSILKAFVDDGLEMDKSLFNWDGSMYSDCLSEYEDFDSLMKDFYYTPDELNEFANIFLENDSLYIWVLHPRKGKSIAIKANNVKKDLSKYQKFISKALI
jgi:hypothetical protein